MNLRELKKVVKKARSEIPVTAVQNECIRLRLEEEWEFLRAKTMAKIFEPQEGERPTLEQVLADPGLSVVGWFSKALHKVALPHMRLTDDPTEFWKRCLALGASKLAAPNEAHMQSLILSGAFGDPAFAMMTWWSAYKPEDPFPEYDYDRELAARTGGLRSVDFEGLEGEFGIRLTTYEMFYHPSTYRHKVWILGQVEEKPRRNKTRNGASMMMIELRAMAEDAEYYENPVYSVTIWSSGLHLLATEPQVGDVLAIRGTRDVYVARRQVQLTVGDSDDRIKVL